MPAAGGRGAPQSCGSRTVRTAPRARLGIPSCSPSASSRVCAAARARDCDCSSSWLLAPGHERHGDAPPPGRSQRAPDSAARRICRRSSKDECAAHGRGAPRGPCPAQPALQSECATTWGPMSPGSYMCFGRQSGSDILAYCLCGCACAGRLAHGAVAGLQTPRGVDTALGRAGQQIHGFPKRLLPAANLFTVSKLFYVRLDSRPYQSVELHPVLSRGAA